MEINPLKQLYEDLMTLVKECEVKYKYKADKYETMETQKQSDAYIAAYLHEDNYNTYYKFDPQVISDVMAITDPKMIDFYHENKNEIPKMYHDELVIAQRNKILKEYTEQNNYYRCISGLPDIEETKDDFIYLSESELQILGLEEPTAVHQLSESQIALLSINFVNDLIEKYPNKKYLKYLGSNKIDIVTARTAKNFALIKIPYGISESLWNTFSTMYEACREYFMSCIYITEYRNIIDYYDNFIALSIMLMAIQQVIARTIKSVIDREFFDDYSVRLLFNLYGIPYNQFVDSNTIKQITQNLNMLVLNKGTNKVIYDIASILGYDRLSIYKYYLVKAQKFNMHGAPQIYHKIDPITGETVLDYEKMYNVYFQKTDIHDLDIYKSLLDTEKRVQYDVVTEDDPFWIEDEALMRELYESEYNYVESKYMGVSISYRLTKILFENVYLLKMIFDKKNELPGVVLELPKISTYGYISLFDAIVILCALTCKVNHLKGEILTDISKIFHVMGFDFSRDFETIRQTILDDKYLDDELVEFFKDSSTPTAKRLNDLYMNFLTLYDVLTEKMASAKDINVYRAYQKFYKSIFFTDESRKMFFMGFDESGNPRYASTFMEYVKYTHPDIYAFIEDLDLNSIYIYTNHITSKVNKLIGNLNCLGFYSNSSGTMETYLMNLIRFFKSYTTDIISFETIIIFDLKPESMLKLIDWIHIHKELIPRDEFHLSYGDTIHYSSIISYKDMYDINDDIPFIHDALRLNDTLSFLNTVHSYRMNMMMRTDIQFMDVINFIMSLLRIKDRFEFRDLIRIYNKFKLKDIISFEDFVKDVNVSIKLRQNMSLYDVAYWYASILAKDNFKLRDTCRIIR